MFCRQWDSYTREINGQAVSNQILLVACITRRAISHELWYVPAKKVASSVQFMEIPAAGQKLEKPRPIPG